MLATRERRAVAFDYRKAERGPPGAAAGRAVGAGVLARPLVPGRLRPGPRRGPGLPALPDQRPGQGRAAPSPPRCPTHVDVRETVARWAGEGATTTATIRLRRDSGYPLRARAVATTPVDADWDELEIPYGHGLDAWLAEFGPDVVVLAPDELRAEVLDRLRAVAKG